MLLALSVGCSEEPRVPNNPPSVEFETGSSDGNVAEVWYWVLDFDGDDVNIDIQVCRQQECFVPTESPGGDGTANLPTLRDEPALHLYRWAAGCDLDAAGYDAELTIEILPTDIRNGEGELVQSDPFVLNDIGVETGCSQQ